MPEIDEMKEINRKLDVIIRLLSYQLVEKKTLVQGAPLLKRMGLTSSEIASIFETTSKSVSTRLAESKKKKEKSKDD